MQPLKSGKSRQCALENLSRMTREHLSHAVSGSVTSDEILKRNPLHFHTVSLIFGFEGLALPGH